MYVCGGGVLGTSAEGGDGGLGDSCASADLEIIVSAAAAIRTIYIALILAVSARPKHADQNLGSAAELSFWVRNLQKIPALAGLSISSNRLFQFRNFTKLEINAA
jgi:hypothetical protein